MSAAAGAGTGAAIGSAISPGLGTIIGAGLGLIGGLFGNSSDKSINKQQLEYNKWALAQQERYNWEMWNATNAYNDPSAEKARYARAGINPAVMFKSGLTDQAHLGSGIDPEAYNPHPVRTPFDSWMNGQDPISKYQQMYQIHKIKSDIDNTNMDTSKKESEKAKVDEEVNLIQIQEKTEAAKATIAQIDADYHEEIVQAGLKKQYEEIENLIQEVENAKTQNDLMKSEEALNKALENLNNWKAKEIKDLLQPRIQAVYAEVKKALADANYTNQLAISESTFRQLRKDGLSLENDLLSFDKQERGALIEQKISTYLTKLKNDKLISDEEYKQAIEETKYDHEKSRDAEYNNRWYMRSLNVIERVNDGVNKWAPWAFSREDNRSHDETVTHYDARGNKTSSTTISRTDKNSQGYRR